MPFLRLTQPIGPSQNMHIPVNVPISGGLLSTKTIIQIMWSGKKNHSEWRAADTRMEVLMRYLIFTSTSPRSATRTM